MPAMQTEHYPAMLSSVVNKYLPSFIKSPIAPFSMDVDEDKNFLLSKDDELEFFMAPSEKLTIADKRYLMFEYLYLARYPFPLDDSERQFLNKHVASKALGMSTIN